MTKNYKLIYNQYKHLIDVFTTGDFLIESLDKPVGLITYRKLLTNDNILYFTQNTKRTCKIPLGVSKQTGSIKKIDLMEQSFKYRHPDNDELTNFRKSIICFLMQNYNPDEYEVYYDFNVDGLDSLYNFHVVTNVDELDSIYSSIARERHKKYIESGVYTYKEYRKNNSDKLVIFLLANREFLNRLECICGGHIRYGISIIAIYEDAIADSSTISLQNTVRPNISDEDMRNEIKIYKRMLGVFNNMKNEINLLTGEIINKGDLHENLVIKLPLTRRIQAKKDKLDDPNTPDYEKELIVDLVDYAENLSYAIYNMREYGYQFGGAHANGDFGSFYHQLLGKVRELDKESVQYVITASVYTLFSHSSPKIDEALYNQSDLSKHDKEILDSYIARQTSHYYNENLCIYNEDFEDDMEDLKDSSAVLYETFFCKIERKGLNLYCSINGNTKKLPTQLLYLYDWKTDSLNLNLVELIVRYELYLAYGVHTPGGIYDTWYTADSFILEHQPVDTSVENLKDRLTRTGALDKCYDKLSNKGYREMISSAYSELDEFKIKSYINYWLTRKEDLRKILPSAKDVVSKNYVIGIMNPNEPEVDEALATTLMINGSRVVVMGDGESFGTVLDGTLDVINELGCNNYSENVISTIVEQLICSAVEGVVLSSSDKEKIREYARRQVSLKSTLKKSTSF